MSEKFDEGVGRGFHPPEVFFLRRPWPSEAVGGERKQTVFLFFFGSKPGMNEFIINASQT